MVFGGAFALLGYFTLRCSRLALGLAIALLVLDGTHGFAAVAAQGGTPLVGGVLTRIAFLVLLVRGFGAIRRLKT